MNQRNSAALLALGSAFALMATAAQAGGGHGHGHGHWRPWFSHNVDKLPTFLMEDVDETAQDDATPGYLWAGSGIPATNFILKENSDAGVELAIKAMYRKGDDIPPTYVDSDGIVHVEVPSGHYPATGHGVPADPERTDLAQWNFTFSYDVALDPTNHDLDWYEGWLLIDVDPSEHTNYLKLRLTKLTNTPTAPQNGYGWVSGSTTVIGDDEGTSKVTQNSQNVGFYNPLTGGYMGTDFGPGQFDVVMRLSRHHGHKVNELHVVFDVADMP